jgi:hypothetical protein
LSPLLLVAVERHHWPSDCLACRVALPLCQPKSIIVVTGNTSRRLDQIHSHGINRHQHRHSWAFVFVHSSSVVIVHYWEHIPSAHSHLIASVGSIVSYCWCFLLVRFFHSSTAAASYSSCCCSCSCFLNSRSALCIFHALKPAIALRYYCCVIILTKQSSSNSLLRSIGRSAASYRSIVSFKPTIVRLPCIGHGTKPYTPIVSSGININRTPTTSHCGLQIAPLCAVGFKNPLL